MVVPLRKDRADWNKFRRNSPDSENPDALPLWITIAKGKSVPEPRAMCFCSGIWPAAIFMRFTPMIFIARRDFLSFTNNSVILIWTRKSLTSKKAEADKPAESRS